MDKLPQRLVGRDVATPNWAAVSQVIENARRQASRLQALLGDTPPGGEDDASNTAQLARLADKNASSAAMAAAQAADGVDTERERATQAEEEISEKLSELEGRASDLEGRVDALENPTEGDGSDGV